MAPADKALSMKEVCDARGVACHYEIRGGRTIFRADYQQGLDDELISLFNADDESNEDEVVFYETPKSDDEPAQKESSELDFGDLSMFDWLSFVAYFSSNVPYFPSCPRPKGRGCFLF